MHDKFLIKKLDSTYIPAMLDLQDEVIGKLDNTDILRKNTIDTLSPCFDPPSLVLGAFCDDLFVAFGILYYAGDDHENLAYSLDAHDDLYTYANIKVVIVKDGYRGHGLQKTFIRDFEKYAKTIGVNTLLSTVSPDNMYSCRNLEQCGYISVKRLKKYGGKDRLLYMKNLGQH